MSTMHTLDVVVREEGYKEDVLPILKVIRPSWKAESVHVKELHGGLTNKLVGCRLSEDKKENDMVLIRIYGKESYHLDRDNEILTMRALHHVGCGEPVYCRFTNGMAYGYNTGICLNPEIVDKENIARGVAKEMARWKASSNDWRRVLKEIGEEDRAEKFTKPSSVMEQIYKLLDKIPEKIKDAEKQARFESEIMDKSGLEKEARDLEKVLGDLHFPTACLTHFDPLPQNIIYDELNDRVKFIDWEFGCFLPLAFDIGAYFAGYTINVMVDRSKYPKEEFQQKWLRWFLECKSEFEGKDPSDVTQKNIDDLHADVNKMALVYMFVGAVWSFGQIENSTVDFDYIGYGRDALSVYMNRKAFCGI